MTIFNYYQKDLELIAQVTKLLNETQTEGEFTYVHIELRSIEGHHVLGEWSDEIGSDSWYYQPLEGTPLPTDVAWRVSGLLPKDRQGRAEELVREDIPVTTLNLEERKN